MTSPKHSEGKEVCNRGQNNSPVRGGGINWGNRKQAVSNDSLLTKELFPKRIAWVRAGGENHHRCFFKD